MLEAGVARADITPPPDIPNGMWVAQSHVRAQGVHQALWLTCLALRDGEERVVILDIDWCLLSDAQAAGLRRAVSLAAGLPERRVIACCSHNHAGPITQDHYQGEGADQVRAYVATLPVAAAEAAAAAMAALEPVRVAAGFGHAEIGLNRDLRLPSGRVVAGPNPDGHADQSVGVLRLERLDGSPLACLLNYACHPTVLGPANVLVSPDYPGTARRVVEQLSGATCLFLPGAAGDMGPREGFVGDPSVAERLGTLLGLEAAKVLLSLDARPLRRRLDRIIESGAPLTAYVDEASGAPEPRLRVIDRPARLSIRSPLPELYEGAEARLEQGRTELERLQREGAPTAELVLAQQRYERERFRALRAVAYRKPAMEVEMHAIAMGEVALLMSWGEIYSRIGREVKEGSPFATTFFCGYVGGDPIYVCTPEAFEEPVPFQVDNCPVGPEAAAETVAQALGLLNDLHALPPAS